MNANLSKAPLNRNYFVNGNIIYEIKDYKYTEDTHAIHVGGGVNEVKIPKIRVTKTGTDIDDIYYLDSLIEDGDKLTFTATTSPFKKTNHMFLPEDEEDFFTYYTKLCKHIIGQTLVTMENYPYQFFVDNKINLGVPEFMVSYNGYALKKADGSSTFSTASTINFTEELYNELKDSAIKERILNAASNEAIKHNYKVNSVDSQKI